MYPHQKPIRKRSVDHIINELLWVKENLPYIGKIKFDEPLLNGEVYELYSHSSWLNTINHRTEKNLYSFDYAVGSDPSSAAFLIALTLLTPGSKSIIHNVLCNDTRIFFLKILKKMNGNIKIKNLKRSKKSGELEGSIITTSSKLKPIKISKDIAKFIDEIPILVVCTIFANGVSKFNHVQQLAHKESNRILEIKKLLKQAGIKCKTTKNSIKIYVNTNNTQP